MLKANLNSEPNSDLLAEVPPSRQIHPPQERGDVNHSDDPSINSNSNPNPDHLILRKRLAEIMKEKAAERVERKNASVS